jgi:SlyX protein
VSTGTPAIVNSIGKRRTFRRRSPVTIPADRLTTLEIRSAEQERTIEELSGQIAEQWKVIERLQKKLDALTERFLTLEENTGPDIPVTKPPHW